MNYSVILGAAGTGKTTELKRRAEENPNFAKVCATTGIAAVNLGAGVTTVHSTLGFYNEESAAEALATGKLTAKFVKLAEQGYENLVIDEISMFTDVMLGIVSEGARLAEERLIARANAGDGNTRPCGVILAGDFLQLSPVKGQYAFFAPVWALYEANLTQLKTIYRQTDPVFLEALTAARAGQGVSCVMALKKAGVEFVPERDDYYDGTSLMPTNDMANKLNATRFDSIDSPIVKYPSIRWGQETGEWKDIPDVLHVKEGAKVMVLANDAPDFNYVNGDTGNVVSVGESTISVDIHRADGSERVMEIPYEMRVTTQKDKPLGVADYSGFLIDGQIIRRPRDIKEWYDTQRETLIEFKTERMDYLVRRMYARFFDLYNSYVKAAIDARIPYYSHEKSRWVVGWISYLPIRLAWASTTHKAQGLTMEKVQIDARNRFMGSPAMAYVALSRCRTPQNIRIVSSPADFARRIQTAKECLRWV